MTLKEIMKDGQNKVMGRYLFNYFNTVEGLTPERYTSVIKTMINRFKIDDETARQYRENFFNDYPELKIYIDRYKELSAYGERSLQAFNNKNPEAIEKVKEDYLLKLVEWIDEPKISESEKYKRQYLFIYMNKKLCNYNIFEQTFTIKIVQNN